VEIGAARKTGRQGLIHSLPSRYVLFFVGKNSRCLFLVAVEAVDGSDGTEEAVLLAVDAGGEE
jgi:hypothetical protein